MEILNKQKNACGRNKSTKGIMSALLLVIIATFAMSNVAKAQPTPYPVGKATYIGATAPTTETLRIVDLWGMPYFEEHINKKNSAYCDTITNEDCDEWYAWQYGVYVLQPAGYACQIRVEYRYRNCMTDWNLTQHDIIALIIKSPNTGACAELDNWLYIPNDPNSISEKINLLYEDMYVKLAIQTFKDLEDFLGEENKEALECGNGVTYPIKSHHVNGSCEAKCKCTYRVGESTETVFTKYNCTPGECCIIYNYTCRNSATGMIENSTQYSSQTQNAMANGCPSNPIPDILECPPNAETCAKLPCKMSCSDDYCVCYYIGWRWNDYPLKETYADFAVATPSLEKKTMQQETQDVVNIYPNPTSKILNIEVVGGIQKASSIQITDNTGKILLNTDNGTLELNSQIDISKLQSGNYFVIVSIDNVKYSRNFVVTK
jgi:hypothetical protein